MSMTVLPDASSTIPMNTGREPLSLMTEIVPIVSLEKTALSQHFSVFAIECLDSNCLLCSIQCVLNYPNRRCQQSLRIEFVSVNFPRPVVASQDTWVVRDVVFYSPRVV